MQFLHLDGRTFEHNKHVFLPDCLGPFQNTAFAKALQNPQLKYDILFKKTALQIFF